MLSPRKVLAPLAIGFPTTGRERDQHPSHRVHLMAEAEGVTLIF